MTKRRYVPTSFEKMKQGDKIVAFTLEGFVRRRSEAKPPHILTVVHKEKAVHGYIIWAVWDHKPEAEVSRLALYDHQKLLRVLHE